MADRYEDTDVVIGGYTADTLYKTHYMSNVEKRAGCPSTLLEPNIDRIKDPNFLEGEVSRIALWNEAAHIAQKRRKKHHKRLKKIRPITAGNWHRLWPISGLKAYGQYLACRRMGAEVVEPFLFSQSYQLAAEMPDTARINRKAFRNAFAKDMGMAGWWPTSSERIPRLGGWSGSLTNFYLGWWRLAKHYLYGQSRGQGPWPTDHTGWDPIRPENHFEQEECELLRSRLNEVLVDGRGSGFFREEGVPVGMKVRALALAFSIS
ncbi:hypothetical protein [Salinibacter ruber]|uniref:hypothetical protein n=1 Tax=Salinibacter ruber TaxID=146919 RepID=UPI002166E2B2|nr:hypothetical protein [Salinibacter ruber]MCS4040858.1 hypothetical protein [Salinibacter ruber]